jgi:ribosomal protein L4
MAVSAASQKELSRVHRDQPDRRQETMSTDASDLSDPSDMTSTGDKPVRQAVSTVARLAGARGFGFDPGGAFLAE